LLKYCVIYQILYNCGAKLGATTKNQKNKQHPHLATQQRFGNCQRVNDAQCNTVLVVIANASNHANVLTNLQNGVIFEQDYNMMIITNHQNSDAALIFDIPQVNIHQLDHDNCTGLTPGSRNALQMINEQITDEIFEDLSAEAD
jgi:hypothetical protein